MPQPSKVIPATSRDFLEDRTDAEGTYRTGQGPGPAVVVPPDKHDALPLSPMERAADALERIASYLERTDPLASLMVDQEVDAYGLPVPHTSAMEPGLEQPT